jgi:glycosyltransferase involved in cell wall biosynthesis
LELEGFSIVICTHNGADRIIPTLEAVSSLNSHLPWEVIIVNNASSDQTELIVSNFLEKNSEVVNGKLIAENTPGLIFARIAGVKEAIYSYILFCDDDNWLEENYLALAATRLVENVKIGALGGMGIPVFEGEKPNWFDQYAHSFAVGAQDWHLGKSPNTLGYLYGAGVIFKKEILENIFDSGIQLALTGRKKDQLVSGDDVELCYLVQLKGFELAYEDQMRFSHWMPKSRLSWPNYLSLKSGIIKSSAMLLPYQFIKRNPSSNVLIYVLGLTNELIKSGLIFLKHSLLGMPNSMESEVSMLILKEKFETFRKDFFKSIRHFNHLKKFF